MFLRDKSRAPSQFLVGALNRYAAYATKFGKARAERKHANFSTALGAGHDVRKSLTPTADAGGRCSDAAPQVIPSLRLGLLRIVFTLSNLELVSSPVA
jgi:hypothetical protein